MSEFIENTRDCLKNNAKIKRLSIFFFFILGSGTTFLLLSFTALNIYFFYLMLAKILIWFNFFYFVVISACASTPQYFQVWNVYDTRIKLFKERMKIAYWWIIKFSIFATILFIFFRYSISAATKYPPILVSQLTPTAGEIILILTIMILSLIVIYTMPYWCVARYIKIRRWDAETKLFKVDLKSLIIGFIPVFFLVLVALIIDLLYIHMRLGLSLGSVQFLEPFLDRYENYLLPLEILVLLLSAIGTYIDGRQQIRSRTTFVIASLLEQVVSK